jgi:hypothetical protein
MILSGQRPVLFGAAPLQGVDAHASVHGGSRGYAIIPRSMKVALAFLLT